MSNHGTYNGSFALILLVIICSCQKEIIDDPGGGQLFDVEIGSSEIPYLVIETKGVGILNEPKIPAELKVYVNKTEIQNVHIGIEFRGSTSFRLSDKKSYGIETWDETGNDMDVEFFDFPMEEDFILMGQNR